MKDEILYQDRLIQIRNKSITLKYYYFPFLPKTIFFSDIEKIEVNEPTWWNGAWRIWGTFDFITWFPFDPLRPSRNKIFIITCKNKRMRSGFTVEDSVKVEELLKEKMRLFNIFQKQ